MVIWVGSKHFLYKYMLQLYLGGARKKDKSKYIVVVVDDTRFKVDQQVFETKPDTMLSKLVSYCLSLPY